MQEDYPVSIDNTPFQGSTLADVVADVVASQAWRESGTDYSRGSIGSLSNARTPKTHSWVRRSGSLRMNRSSTSMPSVNSLLARDRLVLRSHKAGSGRHRLHRKIGSRWCENFQNYRQPLT